MQRRTTLVVQGEDQRPMAYNKRKKLSDSHRDFLAVYVS